MVLGDSVDLGPLQLGGRHRKGDELEGVIGNGDVAADGAPNLRAELAIDQVDQEREVPLQEGHPCLAGHFLVVLTGLLLDTLSVRLLNDLVHVFVESVKEVADELLGVVLSIPLEHAVELAELVLKLDRSDNSLLSIPCLEHEIGVGVQNLAFGAQGVVIVLEVLVLLGEEELGQLSGVAEALETRVHEAGVPQVPESDLPHLGELGLLNETRLAVTSDPVLVIHVR